MKRALIVGALQSAIACAAAFVAASPAQAQPLVTDVCTDALDPNDRSDSQPSLAVDPTDPLHVVVVAFNDNWSPGVAAPVFHSSDGGRTFVRYPQLGAPGPGGPDAQKVAFDSEGRLYVAAMDFAGTNFIFRQAGSATGALTPGKGFAGDQPQLEIDRTPGKGNGKGPRCAGTVYSAFADVALPKWQAMVARDPGTLGATMTPVVVGTNASFGNRGARVAVGPEGRVYAVYKTEEGQAGAAANFEYARFHVVRSDDCGASFGALAGAPGAGEAAGGVLVSGPEGVQTFLTTGFGNAAKGKLARARASDTAIAVDPIDGALYVAFVKRDASLLGQIYVARSQDGGAHFTTVRATDGFHHAAFPALAVTESGTVGLLYLDYDDGGPATIFRHRFARSGDAGAHWKDELLQSLPLPASDATLGAASGYLFGDEQALSAWGNTFYGVFTGLGTGRKNPQLDPIFFREGAALASGDFYVRDFTDSPTSGDDGRAPHARTDFYETSDLWNRRGDDPGSIDTTTDLPDHQTPKNGDAIAGDNFLFARIRRLASGPATTVTARFAYADFGVGNNFVAAGDPAGSQVSFSPGQTLKIMAPREGHAWHLGTTSSRNLSLAVEIEAPGDPSLAPTLAGHAPGGGEVQIAGDNNRAELGVDVYEAGEGQPGAAWAVVHNPALETRTVNLRVTVGAASLKRLGGGRIEVPGAKPRPLKAGDTIAFEKMRPGENRFVSLAWSKLLPGAGPADTAPLAVRFDELWRSHVVNGFSIIVQPSPEEVIGHGAAALQRSVAARLPIVVSSARRGDAKVDSATLSALRDQYRKAAADAAGLERKKAMGDEDLLALAQAHADTLRNALPAVSAESDPFGLSAGLAAVDAALGSKQPAAVAAAHVILLRKLDANLTSLQKSKGDLADVLQMVRWQGALLGRIPALAKSLEATRLAGASRTFAASWEARKSTVEQYPKLFESTLPEWHAIEQALPDAKIAATLASIEANLTSPTALQHLHRALLLALEPLAKH